jgi:hypothetical protein
MLSDVIELRIFQIPIVISGGLLIHRNGENENENTLEKKQVSLA